MSKNKFSAGGRTVPLVLPVLFSLFSICISIFLFVLISGIFSTAGIISGVVIPLPEIACVFIIYRRSGTVSAERADIKYPDVLFTGNGSRDTDNSGQADERVTGLEKKLEEQKKAADSICREIEVRMRLFSPVLEEMNTSISSSLSSTTEPLSAELLHIRESSNAFLESIRSYEDEVRNRTAASDLEKESTVFEQGLAGLYGTVRSVFEILEKNIEDLRSISVRIGGTAESISELSEQIRVLSFNASIEAARAGQAGAGFRVIAGEIKRLSAGTDERLDEIQNTLKDTRRIFSGLKNELENRNEEILGIVADRQTGFSSFKKALEEYFSKLELLYTGVTQIIDSLTKSMNVFSPVVQLHEITSQEIGNMGHIVTDLCGWTRNRAACLCGQSHEGPGKEDAAETAAEIRKYLTTEKELEALGRGIRRTVPDADMDLGINNRSIELF
jgi:methyl-accepting chemotaxis protein